MAIFHNRNMGGVSDDDAFRYEAERRLNWADGLILNYGNPTEVDLVHGFGSRSEIRDYHARMRDSFSTLRDQVAAEQDATLLSTARRSFPGTTSEFVTWYAEWLQLNGTAQEWNEFKQTVLELKRNGVELDDHWAETDSGDDRARALAETPREPMPTGFERHRFLTPIQERALAEIDRMVDRYWPVQDVAQPYKYDRRGALRSGDEVMRLLHQGKEVLAERRPLTNGDYLRIGVFTKGNLMTDTAYMVSNALNLSMYSERGKEGIWLPEFHRRVMPVIGVGVDGQVKPGLHPAPVAREFTAEEVIAAAVEETVTVMRDRTTEQLSSLERQLTRMGHSAGEVANVIGEYLRGSEFQRQFRLESKAHFKGLIEHFDGDQIGKRAYGARDASRLIFGLVNDRLSLNADAIPRIDPITLALSTAEQRATFEAAQHPGTGTELQAFGIDRLQRIGGGLTTFDFTFMAQGLYRRKSATNAQPARFFLNEHLARFGVTANLDRDTNVYFIPATKWAQIPQRTQTLAAMTELTFHGGEGSTLQTGTKLFKAQAGDERQGVDLRGFIVFGLGDTGFMNEHVFGRAKSPRAGRNFTGSMVSYTQTKTVSIPTHQLQNGLLAAEGTIFNHDINYLPVAQTVEGEVIGERSIMNPAAKYGAGSYTVVKGVGAERLGYYTRVQVAYEVYRPFTSMDRIMDVLKVPVIVAKRALFQRVGHVVKQLAHSPLERAAMHAAGMDPDRLGDTINILAGEGVVKTGEVAMQTGASMLMDRAMVNELMKVKHDTLADIVKGMTAKDTVTGRELFANLRQAPVDQVRRMLLQTHRLLARGEKLSVSNMDHVAASYVAFEIVQRSFRDSTAKGSHVLSRLLGFDRDGGTPIGYMVPVRAVAGFSASATQLGTRNVGFMTYYNSGDGTDTLLEMLSESDQSAGQRKIVGELYANTLFGGMTGRTLFGGIHFDPLVYLKLGENAAGLGRVGRVAEALRTGVYTKDVVDRTTGETRRVSRQMALTPHRIARLQKLAVAAMDRAENAPMEVRTSLTTMRAAEAMDVLKAQKAFGTGATSMTFPILNRDMGSGKIDLMEMKRVDFLSPEAALGIAAHVDHVGPIAQLQIDIQKQMAVLSRMGTQMGAEDWERYERLRDMIEEYDGEKRKLIGSGLQKAFGRVTAAGRSAILGAVPGVPEGTLVVGAELYKILTSEARKGVIKVADQIQQSRPGMRRVEAILTAFGEDPLTAKPDKLYGKVAELAKLKGDRLAATQAMQSRVIGAKSPTRGPLLGKMSVDELRAMKKDPAARRELARRAAVKKSYQADDRFASELQGLERRFRSKGLLAANEAMPTDLHQISQLQHAENLLRMTHSGASDFMRAALQRSGAPIGHLALSMQQVMSIQQHNKNVRRTGGVELSAAYSTRAVFANLAGMSVFLGDFDGDTASVAALEQWAMGTAWERAASLGFTPTGRGKQIMERMQRLRNSVLGNPDQQLIEFARHYTGDDDIKTKHQALSAVQQAADVYGKLRLDAIKHIEANTARLEAARDGKEREAVLHSLIEEHVSSQNFKDSIDKLKTNDKLGEPIKNALLQSPAQARAVATAIAWSATSVIGQTFEAAYKGSMLLRANRHLMQDRFTTRDMKMIDGIYHSMNQLVRDAIKPKDIETITKEFSDKLLKSPTEMIRQNELVKGAEAMLILTSGRDFYHREIGEMHGPKLRGDHTSDDFKKYLGDIREALYQFHGVYDKNKNIINERRAHKISQNVETFGKFLAESQEYFRWMSKYKHAAKNLATPDFEALSAEMDGAAGNKLNPNHVRLLTLWSSASRGKLGSDGTDESMGRILTDILQHTPDASRLQAEANMVDSTGHFGRALYEVASRVVGDQRNSPLHNPEAAKASQALLREVVARREGIVYSGVASSAAGGSAPHTVAAQAAAARAGVGHHLVSNMVLPIAAIALLEGTPADARDMGALGASVALGSSVPGMMIMSLRGVNDPRQFLANAAAMGATLAGATAMGQLATHVATNMATKFATPAMAGRIGGLIGALASTVVGWGINEFINHDRPMNDRIGFSRVAQGFGSIMQAQQEATAEETRRAGSQDEVEELTGAPSTQLVTEDGVILPWGDDQPADNGSYTNIIDEVGEALTHYSRDDYQVSEGFDFGGGLDRGSIRGNHITTDSIPANNFGLFSA